MQPLKSMKMGGFSPFARYAEKIGKEAVRKAIAEHKAAGNPIYYSNEKGQMIKELADGKKYLVKISIIDGSEKIGKQVH